MENQHQKKIFGLAATSSVGLFIVIIMGFIDTVTASTMGCGKEWPLCQGGLIPTHWTKQAIIEYSHRIVVFLVIVLLVTTCILAWKKYRQWFEIKLFIGLGVLAVFVESGLGALSVLTNQSPFVLACHLGTALTALTSIVLLTVVIRQIESDPNKSQLRKVTPVHLSRLAKFSMVYAFVAIYVGAYVTHSGYGYLFRGWPIPTESIQQGLLVDIFHRTIAFGLFIIIVTLVYKSNKIKTERKDLFYGSLIALTLTVLQIFSGSALVATHGAMQVFLVHVSIASLIFVSIAYITLQTSGETKRLFSLSTSKNSASLINNRKMTVAHHKHH
jgi:heme a synthase